MGEGRMFSVRKGISASQYWSGLWAIGGKIAVAPIDIQHGRKLASNLRCSSFNYQPADLDIVNDWHTIIGSPSSYPTITGLKVGKKPYFLSESTFSLNVG